MPQLGYFFNLCIVFGVAVTLFPVPESRGGILSNGTLTRDVETGLEYLDVGITRGQFLSNFVTYGTWESHSHPGFHLATNAETLSLFNAVGIAPGVNNSLAYYTPITTLHAFMGPAVPGNPSGSFTQIDFTTSDQVSPNVFRSYRLYAYHPGATGSLWETSGHAWNVAGQFTGALLVRDVPNGTSDNALAPSSSLPGSLNFTGAPGDGVWFDLSELRGNDFVVTALNGAKITHFAVSSDFSDADDMLTVIDPGLLETMLSPGDLHEFDAPVDYFAVTGIADGPASTGISTAAIGDLPLLVRFDSPDADFTVTIVPEPMTICISLLGLALLGRRRRRSW